MKLCLKKNRVPHNIVINELCVLHTISWSYRKKKQGFLFVKRSISLSLQHTGTITALFVPVLLRITHHLKTGVLVSSPNLYSPCLRFIYDWKPYCYSTVSTTLWFNPCQFSIHISPLSISQKKVVSFTKYWRPKSWKVPQRKESCPRWACELNIFPVLFVRVNRPITQCDAWQFVTRVTKLKICCKKQNSGVLWPTLCHNLQDENLLRHKLSAQVVIRTITLCNLQFGKINITRQVKCFFEWFASCLRNRKWRYPLLQVFHRETVIVLVSMI